MHAILAAKPSGDHQRGILSRFATKSRLFAGSSSRDDVSEVKSEDGDKDAHKPMRLSSLQRENVDAEDSDEEMEMLMELPFWPTLRSVRVKTYRELIYWTLDDPSSSGFAKATMITVMTIICFSCVCFCLESMPVYQRVPDDCKTKMLNTTECFNKLLAGKSHEAIGCYDCAPTSIQFFKDAETACIVVFTIEYLLRILTVHALRARDEDNELLPKKLQPGVLRKVWLYWKDTMNLVDFFAIVPFYIELMFAGSGSGLAVLRVLRLARVFRVFKLGKYSSGMQMFANTITESLPALSMVGFLLIIAVVLCGSMVYFAESGPWGLDKNYNRYVQTRPTVDGYDIEASPFVSIPSSFWWVVITATTVGYGDQYPTTTMGKVVGSFVSLGGIILLALPITIIGQNFQHNYMLAEHQKKEKKARQSIAVRRKRSSSANIVVESAEHAKNEHSRRSNKVAAARQSRTSADFSFQPGVSPKSTTSEPNSIQVSPKSTTSEPNSPQSSFAASSFTAKSNEAMKTSTEQPTEVTGTDASVLERRIIAQEQTIGELKDMVKEMHELLESLCMQQGVNITKANFDSRTGSGRKHASGRSHHR